MGVSGVLKNVGVFLFLMILIIPVYAVQGESLSYQELYLEMKLGTVVNYEAFEQALKGYEQIEEKDKGILALIDFTKPSSEERLYVLDMKNRKLLFSSYVSHGRNSGDKFATSFSNREGSYKSSLGFFLTGDTYYGKNGYSLVLEGLEKNINDNARERAIVIHGAPYSDPSVIASSGRLGRSLGCPALPPDISRSVIDTIKGGALLYIYANNREYLRESEFLTDWKV